jgi:hypothetical protein
MERSAFNPGDRRGHALLAGHRRRAGRTLAGRTRAEEERERQQDAVAKWLKKDGDDKSL